MEKLTGKKILITGGTKGLGRAVCLELASAGAELAVIGRDIKELQHLQKSGVNAIKGDVTDKSIIENAIKEIRPEILILNAGATPIMGSIEEQTWQSFNLVWEMDVKACFFAIQAALNNDTPSGSRTYIISSGAALVGAPMSGSYAGAKNMLWFLAQYANELSATKGLNITFQLIFPMQMFSETGLAKTVAAAYADNLNLTIDEYLEERYGSPLSTGNYAEYVKQLLADPSTYNGFAYGIKKDKGITSINQEWTQMPVG